MNGIHDMGGMHGFGELDIETNEPVFHEPWEGRVFAMAIFSSTTIPGGFRYMIEKIRPSAYLAYTYYEKWMHASLEGLLQRGVVSERELEEKINLLRKSPDTLPPVTRDRTKVAKVIRDIYRPLEIQTDKTSTGLFDVGQTVRAKNFHPHGHTRLPAYCKGKLGVVEHCYGKWPVDDTPPQGQPHAIENLYRVRFEARELWGDDAETNHALYIDMFDSYLDTLEDIAV